MRTGKKIQAPDCVDLKIDKIRNMSAKLIFLIFLPALANSQKSHSFSTEDFSKNVTVQLGEISQFYSQRISKSVEFHYIFKYRTTNFKREALKLTTKVVDLTVDEKHPLRVSVRYDKGSTNWQIPFKPEENGRKINQMAKILCLYDGDLNEKDMEIVVVFSTSYLKPFQFEFQMMQVENFSPNVGQKNQVKKVEFGSPQYNFVDLTSYQHKGLIQITVTSEEEDICAIISGMLPCPAPYLLYGFTFCDF